MWCRRGDSNPHGGSTPADFESAASTNSATSARWPILLHDAEFFLPGATRRRGPLQGEPSHDKLSPMKIGIGSDHAGYRYKESIKEFLRQLGHEVEDFGTDSTESVDYPLFIHPVAKAVADGGCQRGIVLGGSGNGEAMAANRVRGVRCALCWNVESARLAREHNDANMLSLGERMISLRETLEIVRIWLETPFEGGRHVRRIKLLDELD